MDPKPEMTEADAEVLRVSRRRTLRSFAGFGLAAAAGYGSWRWLTTRCAADDIPWPLRRGLQFNQKLSEAIFRRGSRMDERPAGSAPAGQTRVNTSIGVDQNLDPADYRLRLTGLRDGDVTLTLAQLTAFPKTVQTTRLCCVEGWNTWANWAGVRVADVVARHPSDPALPYVGMATTSGDYYVGLDRASALHPQTLLVYELDGQPLSARHGAPVRLAIPTKYGIKNIKQVATVAFTNVRPPDYWAERGYDWFAGL